MHGEWQDEACSNGTIFEEVGGSLPFMRQNWEYCLWQRANRSKYNCQRQAIENGVPRSRLVPRMQVHFLQPNTQAEDRAHPKVKHGSHSSIEQIERLEIG